MSRALLSPDPAASPSTPVGLRSVFAELQLGRDCRLIAFSNAADQLFGGKLRTDALFAEVLDDAEMSGIIAPGSAGEIVEAARTHHRHLFEMRDGRSMSLSSVEDGFGNSVLSITDVSHVVSTTLSRQRDVLTGLPNRPEMTRFVQAHISSNIGKGQGAVLFLDLDKFKLVNDTLGHPIGDALLKLVADRLSRVLGPNDLLARIGGDEFVILQQDANQPHAAEALASRIIELIGRAYLIRGHSVQIGVSVGIALTGRDGHTPDELFKHADLALVKAKAGGRSTFRFFTEAMDAEIRTRRALQIDLQRALVLEEFALSYQPQFEIDGKRLVGFEALVRWSTPERGPVSPGSFIPVIEEIGLMDRLGDWVLRRACEDASSWPRPLSVSVNVSPVQIKNPRFIETVVSALAHSGLPAHRLDIEITENALMDDTQATLSVLNQLKSLGIKISMDDFGTGYSSLSYLQKFPFDKIKIDQSFIKNMETNADSASIVRAVAALGEGLGMTTIAEGVETETQLTRITDNGCKQVQGYLTGRPMPSNEAAALAQAQTETRDA